METTPGSYLAPTRTAAELEDFDPHRMDDVLVGEDTLEALTDRQDGSITLKVEGSPFDVTIEARNKGVKVAPLRVPGLKKAITYGEYTGRTSENHPDIQTDLLPATTPEALITQIKGIRLKIVELLPPHLLWVMNEIHQKHPDRKAIEKIKTAPETIQDMRVLTKIASALERLAISDLAIDRQEDLEDLIVETVMNKLATEKLYARKNRGSQEQITTRIPLAFSKFSTKGGPNSIREAWINRVLETALSKIQSLLKDPVIKNNLGIHQSVPTLSINQETQSIVFSLTSIPPFGRQPLPEPRIVH